MAETTRKPSGDWWRRWIDRCRIPRLLCCIWRRYLMLVWFIVVVVLYVYTSLPSCGILYTAYQCRATQNPLYVEDVETKSTLYEAVTNVLVQYFWMLWPAHGRSVNVGEWSNFQILHCSWQFLVKFTVNFVWLTNYLLIPAPWVIWLKNRLPNSFTITPFSCVEHEVRINNARMFSASVCLLLTSRICIIVSISRLRFSGHAASISTTSTSLVQVTLSYDNFSGTAPTLLTSYIFIGTIFRNTLTLDGGYQMMTR